MKYKTLALTVSVFCMDRRRARLVGAIIDRLLFVLYVDPFIKTKEKSRRNAVALYLQFN